MCASHSACDIPSLAPLAVPGVLWISSGVSDGPPAAPAAEVVEAGAPGPMVAAGADAPGLTAKAEAAAEAPRKGVLKRKAENQHVEGAEAPPPKSMTRNQASMLILRRQNHPLL